MKTPAGRSPAGATAVSLDEVVLCVPDDLGRLIWAAAISSLAASGHYVPTGVSARGVARFAERLENLGLPISDIEAGSIVLAISDQIEARACHSFDTGPGDL